MNAERVAIATDTKGWLHPGEGETLRRWALNSTGLLLELGTYCGKSTVWIGDAAEQTGRTLVTIDWHHGSPEMDPGQACHDPDMLDRDGVHDTVPHLRRTLRRAGLEDTVVPIIGKSLQVGEWWSTEIGFAFIDASHGADVIDDYRWISDNMGTGVLCFHDSEIPPIHRAIRQAQADGFEWRETCQSLTVLSR
jgi:predicted O-methyltransferase YrrM